MASRVASKSRCTDEMASVGEVVLVVFLHRAQGNWHLQRVVEIYTGVDGRVRVAKLQVGEGTLVRPVVKLCPLECDS